MERAWTTFMILRFNRKAVSLANFKQTIVKVKCKEGRNKCNLILEFRGRKYLISIFPFKT